MYVEAVDSGASRKESVRLLACVVAQEVCCVSSVYWMADCEVGGPEEGGAKEVCTKATVEAEVETEEVGARAAAEEEEVESEVVGTAVVLGEVCEVVLGSITFEFVFVFVFVIALAVVFAVEDAVAAARLRLKLCSSSLPRAGDTFVTLEVEERRCISHK